LIPSNFPIATPSDHPSQTPSVVPSDFPSLQPSAKCDADILNGKVINFAYNFCYQVTFEAGGKILIDTTKQMTCVGANFPAGSSSISDFSNFSGTEAIFSTGDLGWNGVFNVIYTGTSFAWQAVIPDPAVPYFVINLYVASCDPNQIPGTAEYSMHL
jgi:hypothetical protein